MAKRRFLLKGGKGKIGLGARQILDTDVLHIYEDNIEDFRKVYENLNYTRETSEINFNSINYGRLFYKEMSKDDFSEGNSLFSGKYSIVKNSKNEFFFGVNGKMADARFDPRGTFIRIVKFPLTENKRPKDFYCLVNETPSYEKDQLVFYRIYSDYNPVLQDRNSYFFSVVREDIPSLREVLSKGHEVINSQTPYSTVNIDVLGKERRLEFAVSDDVGNEISGLNMYSGSIFMHQGREAFNGLPKGNSKFELRPYYIEHKNFGIDSKVSHRISKDGISLRRVVSPVNENDVKFSKIKPVDNASIEYNYQLPSKSGTIALLDDIGIGLKTKILIGKQEFEYKSIKGSITNIQPGDLALNGLISETELGTVLKYKGGDVKLLASWEVLSSVNIGPEEEEKK